MGSLVTENEENDTKVCESGTFRAPFNNIKTRVRRRRAEVKREKNGNRRKCTVSKWVYALRV